MSGSIGKVVNAEKLYSKVAKISQAEIENVITGNSFAREKLEEHENRLENLETLATINTDEHKALTEALEAIDSKHDDNNAALTEALETLATSNTDEHKALTEALETLATSNTDEHKVLTEALETLATSNTDEHKVLTEALEAVDSKHDNNNAALTEALEAVDSKHDNNNAALTEALEAVDSKHDNISTGLSNSLNELNETTINLSNEVLDTVEKYKKATLQLTTCYGPLSKVPTAELLAERGINKTPEDFVPDGYFVNAIILRGSAVFIDINSDDTEHLYIATCTHLLYDETGFPNNEFILDSHTELDDNNNEVVKSEYYPLYSIDSIDTNTDISDFTPPYSELNSMSNCMGMILSNGKYLRINKLKSCFYRWNIPSDCAILKIPIAEIDKPDDFDINNDIKKLKFASKCSIGEKVIKFGYTAGDFNSYHTGFVRDDSFYDNNPQSPGFEASIMITSAEGSGGDSGGALINMNGEILGIGSYGTNSVYGVLNQTYKKFKLLLEVPQNKLTSVNRYPGNLMVVSFNNIGGGNRLFYPTLLQNESENELFYHYLPNIKSLNRQGEQRFYNELAGAFCTMAEFFQNPYDLFNNTVQGATLNYGVNWEYYKRTGEYDYLGYGLQNVVKIETLDAFNNVLDTSVGPFIALGNEDNNNILNKIYFGQAIKVKLYFLDFMNEDRSKREYDIIFECTDDMRIKSAFSAQNLNKNKNKTIKSISTKNLHFNNSKFKRLNTI